MDPLSRLTLTRLMNTFSVRKQMKSALPFAPGQGNGEGEVLCDALHMLEHEGDGFAAGCLFAAPDLTQGRFGNVVGERFFVDARGSFLTNHITMLYESGIMSYLRVVTNEVGNMYLKMVCFHPSNPDKLLMAMAVDERRDCDYCFTRQSNCDCMTTVKQRYKDWFRIFRRLKSEENSSWSLFKALCDIAADGHFRVNIRAWVPAPEGMQLLLDTQSAYNISFLLRGEPLERRRQQCINSRVNLNLDNLFDVYAQLIEEDGQAETDAPQLDERNLLSDLSIGDPTFCDQNAQAFGDDGSPQQTFESASSSQINSEDAQFSEEQQNASGAQHSHSSRDSTETHTCSECKLQFSSRENLTAHMKRHSRQTQQHRCPTCGRTFPSNYKIDRHIRAVHLRERSFKCHLCPSQYYQKSDLKKHFRVRHSSPEVGQPIAVSEEI